MPPCSASNLTSLCSAKKAALFSFTKRPALTSAVGNFEHAILRVFLPDVMTLETNFDKLVVEKDGLAVGKHTEAGERGRGRREGERAKKATFAIWVLIHITKDQHTLHPFPRLYTQNARI
jgi:hypothetical protein